MKKILFLATILCCNALLASNYSPYITRVVDYLPAPGQFVNVLPTCNANDTKEAVLTRAAEAVVGKKNGSLIHLGSWGGYIVVGFDHTIRNVPNERDFYIGGNAFDGNSEPGIVMVSQDVNNNGEADDEWYELAGSEYNNPATIKNYRVTYYKPTPELDAKSGNINEYILWKDNQGQQGFVKKNMFHKQSYYPLWVQNDSLVFEGTLLPPNATKNGSTIILQAYEWGYADTFANKEEEKNYFDIDWAVDKNGNPVHLNGVDFVKIYTGVLQDNGTLGECSTEFVGIEDLHANSSNVENASEKLFVQTNISASLFVQTTEKATATLYTISGYEIANFDLQSGDNTLATNHLAQGIYFLKIKHDTTQQLFKLIKK